MAKYKITEARSQIPGHTLLRWEKDGRPHPLNFWHVPDNMDLETAKARIMAGELD